MGDSEACPLAPPHPLTPVRFRPQAWIKDFFNKMEDEVAKIIAFRSLGAHVGQLADTSAAHTVALAEQTVAIAKLRLALRRALAKQAEPAAARAAPSGVGPAARDEVRLQPSAPSLAPGASSEPPLQALPSHLAPGASSGTGSSCSPLAERSGNSTNSPETRRREQAAKPAAPPAALPVTAPPAAPPVAPLVEAPKSPRLQRTSGARSGKSTRP